MSKKLFFGAITLQLLFSCGENRNDENIPQPNLNQQIVGTWTISKKESNGVNIPVSQSCPNHGNFTFNTDKTLIEKYNSTVNNVCVNDTDNFTYLIDENNKKITTKNAQNDQLIYTINNLSDNQLILTNTEGTDITKFTFTK